MSDVVIFKVKTQPPLGRFFIGYPKMVRTIAIWHFIREQTMKKLILIATLMLPGCASNQSSLSHSVSSNVRVPIETSKATGSIYQSVYASRYGVNLRTGTYLRNLLGLDEYVNINVNW